ncbi:hypothetical protein [Helicobacter sp. UBA3407]|uniref:hypothetical protein n=1 Tax=Helicobacter TaxID=209 RepID=UPI002606681C|nr:hypothetical protein [Helicobacter sp. UBA3407]
MESFDNKEIVFYSLSLDEKEIKDLQESPEILEDLLEDKVCSLLNLPRTCEYFSRFFTQDAHTYHCLLLNKDSLKKYVSDAQTYLSHPCFLCEQFSQETLESQAFLVLDVCAKWTLIYYHKGKITFLQSINNLQIAQDKIKLLNPNPQNFALFFWLIGEMNPAQSEELKSLQSLFNTQILQCKLEEVLLLDSYNFNPLEKTLPLSQRKVGKALKFALLGASVGIGIWLVLLILDLLKSREIENLQRQIQEKNIQIHNQIQSYTQSQKQVLLLKEKLESLQTLEAQNAHFLQNAIPNALVPFFHTLNPILQQYNVKIAYFGLEKDSLHLLFRGKNTLQALEKLEKSPWGNVQRLEKYQEFYWIQIAFRIPQ